MVYKIKRGWYGDTPGHRDAALRAGAGKACNRPMQKKEHPTKVTATTTILDVYNWLKANESETWDEYISVFNLPNNIDDMKLFTFLERGRLEVLPVFGSNEGIYCHVSIADYNQEKTKKIHSHLFTLKTLDSSRSKLLECFTSAGRIYNYLTGGY